MIKPGEIQKIARKCVVRDTQIEKDYVLSWILYGIAKHKKLSKTFVFKGGTALKKAYFQDYRFSEDLDFTLLDEAITKKSYLNGLKNCLYSFVMNLIYLLNSLTKLFLPKVFITCILIILDLSEVWVLIKKLRSIFLVMKY